MPIAKKNTVAQITKTDGRKNNGRKPGTKVQRKEPKLTPAKLNKKKKERIKLYAINAIKEEFGSEQSFFEHLTKEARKNYNHLKLLMEYAYGKPEDYQGLGQGQKQAPVINFYGSAPLPPADETIDVEYNEESEDE